MHKTRMVFLSLPHAKTLNILMYKSSLFLLLTFLSFQAFAQKSGDILKGKLTQHPSDHFLLQLSSDRWLQAPDSIENKRGGNSRGANIYFMMDKPFKSNSHFSVAFGVGIGTSHIFLEKTNVDIAGNTPKLLFDNRENASSYKKYKVATTYLEIPVELRFSSNPSNPSQSFKFAIGARVGTLLNAHTKGKRLRDASGNTITSSVQKVSARSYFNSNRLMATARIGYGNYVLFGAYGLGSVFKDGVAADMRLLQVGFTFTGL